MNVVTNICNSARTLRALSGASWAERLSERLVRMKCTSEQVDKVPASRFVSVDLNDGTGSTGNRTEPGEINFEDHKNAFRQKSTWEVARSLCVLRMSAVNYFVDNSLSIMKWTRRALGRKGLRTFFKPILFKQFVGGETQKEIQECLRRLAETNVRPMLAAAMEENIGENDEMNESVYEGNCTKILECLEIASAENTCSPMMQLKLTALLPAQLIITLSKLYENSKEKSKLIETFAQGLTQDGFSTNPWPDLLDDKMMSQLRNALTRLRKIGEDASARSVKVLVDAEFTYMNAGLSLLTMGMASIYNKNKPLIWNTYQCYLKDVQSKLREEMQLAQQLHLYFGAKLVRGAYMEQERARALDQQVPCPVCEDYNATNENYNSMMQYLLAETKKRWPKCTFIAATHNEESVRLAILRMKELNIDKQNGGVCFGQLYGMCDQVTFALAASSYVVYKSVPYGTVEETLPYLARRAAENKTVLTGTRKEQSLLWKEMKYRMRPTRREHRSVS